MLSPVSNNVFERRLIVKYIHENGTDPINGESLTEEQLLEIKGSAHERLTCCLCSIMGEHVVILINARLYPMSECVKSAYVLCMIHMQIFTRSVLACLLKSIKNWLHLQNCTFRLYMQPIR